MALANDIMTRTDIERIMKKRLNTTELSAVERAVIKDVIEAANGTGNHPVDGMEVVRALRNLATDISSTADAVMTEIVVGKKG